MLRGYEGPPCAAPSATPYLLTCSFSPVEGATEIDVEAWDPIGIGETRVWSGANKAQARPAAEPGQQRAGEKA